MDPLTMPLLNIYAREIKSVNKSICEVLIGDEWKVYDGHGVDTQKSRDWYSTAYVVFAQGSFQTRINGVMQKNMTSPDSLFYTQKTQYKIIPEFL